MNKKLLMNALLISLLAPTLSLHTVSEETQELVLSLLKFAVRASAITGAIGGTWFIMSQVKKLFTEGHPKNAQHTAQQNNAEELKQFKETVQRRLDDFSQRLKELQQQKTTPHTQTPPHYDSVLNLQQFNDQTQRKLTEFGQMLTTISTTVSAVQTQQKKIEQDIQALKNIELPAQSSSS